MEILYLTVPSMFLLLWPNSVPANHPTYRNLAWPRPLDKLSFGDEIYDCLSNCVCTQLDEQHEVFIAMEIGQQGNPPYSVEEGTGQSWRLNTNFCRFCH